jgi:uncharacterized protein YeaO (DUF488 family)
MLKTKSILYDKEDTDGLRISVMSRHTLNDGVTPHPEITSSSYNQWLQILAPPAKLIGDYYKRGLPWEKFEQKYLDYIRSSNVQLEVQKLAEQSLDSVITLLCIEESPEFCHRRLLAEECKKYQPNLVLSVR